MTTLLMMVLLSAGVSVPDRTEALEWIATNAATECHEHGVDAARPHPLVDTTDAASVRTWSARVLPPADVGAFAAEQSAGTSRRDSLWNGILIGAALGVVGILTTAAEAPASGKVAIIVMSAALGGYVDSRLQVTSPVPPPRGAGGGRRLVVAASVRF
jgi:hypothetical protein